LTTVPRFEPFAGIRYNARFPQEAVTAPPYDVQSVADRMANAARHEHNVVKVDVPVEADGDGRYDEAAALWYSWLRTGVLRRDLGPSYYRYRMTFNDEAGRSHTTTGVFGLLEVRELNTGEVLPHEQTTPKDKTDRLDLTRATRAQLSAVWGLSMAPGIGRTMSDAPGEPAGDFTSSDGVHHQLERIIDPTAVTAIQSAIESHSVVIADGHHRYEISRVYRRERQAAGEATGPHDVVLTFVVELAPDELFVQGIHRLLTGLPAGINLVDALAPWFTHSAAGPVNAATPAAMLAAGGLCLVHPDGTGTFLHPRADAFAGERDLDTVRLQRALEGIAHTVKYQHGVDHIVAAVTSGAAQAGVLVRPVPIHEIERTANEGLLMPPKSTFFAPKPKTGVIFRSLD
jgi:uncharacterized protein (DUF1015 family)